jgi:hypothetical protein
LKKKVRRGIEDRRLLEQQTGELANIEPEQEQLDNRNNSDNRNNNIGFRLAQSTRTAQCRSRS